MPGWNPLACAREALDMAIRLGINILPYVKEGVVEVYADDYTEENPFCAIIPIGGDPAGAACRAITISAASVGEFLLQKKRETGLDAVRSTS